MKKQKSVFGPKDGGTYAARVADRYAGRAPDWIMVLAQRMDAEVTAGGSQTILGKKLGLPGSAISALLGKTYPGQTNKLEAIVRGKLMSAAVHCPALGSAIGRDACAGYQKRKFSAANPQLVKLSKTCPTCPNFLSAKS